MKKIPKVGAIVETPNGNGVVIETNPISKVLKIRLNKAPDAAPAIYKSSEVKLIKDAQIKVDKKELEELKKLE